MNRFLLIAGVSIVFVTASALHAEDKVDFEKQILPIFMEHCASCHGAEKASGKLRLNTAASILEKWEVDENLIVVGDPEKSELYARLVLPADSKKRMPKDADPLPKEKIDLIGAWIKQGADLASVTPTAEPAPPAKDEMPADETPADEAKPAPSKPLPLPEVGAAPQQAIDKIASAGATVLPLYAESNLLQVSFPGRSKPIGDAEIALLAGAAEQIHTLNLANAQVSAAGLAPLALLKNLSVLHLERSNITDEALAHLSGLDRLEYLNLYGTAITDAGLNNLSGLSHLKKLYLWQTKASYDVAMALEKDIPGLTVNLGYDHPVVAKMRLTQELDVVKKQAEEAKNAEEKARQQHEATKQQLEATNARLAELEKQLKELEGNKPSSEASPAPQASEAKAEPAAESAVTTQ